MSHRRPFREDQLSLDLQYPLGWAKTFLTAHLNLRRDRLHGRPRRRRRPSLQSSRRFGREQQLELFPASLLERCLDESLDRCRPPDPQRTP